MKEIPSFLPADVNYSILKTRNEVEDLVANPDGKFRVLGVDRFDNSHWVSGEFDTPEEALVFARDQTLEARPYASDSSIATVYYAYMSDGKYLGDKPVVTQE